MDIAEMLRRILRLEKKVACSCSKVQFYTDYLLFPTEGGINVLYVNSSTGTTHVWNGSSYFPSITGG